MCQPYMPSKAARDKVLAKTESCSDDSDNVARLAG